MEKKSKDAGKSSSLTDEKIQLLEEAGFVWAKRKGQVAWEEKFRELQEYLLKNGNCKSNFLKFRHLYSDNIGRPANSNSIGFYILISCFLSVCLLYQHLECFTSKNPINKKAMFQLRTNTIEPSVAGSAPREQIIKSL